MNCDAARERFALLSEDELSAEETLAARAHLAECGDCEQAYRDVERLVAELRETPTPPVPPHVDLRITAALDAIDQANATGHGPRRRSFWEVAAPYLAAAAVVIIAFALGALLRRPGSWSITGPPTPMPLGTAIETPINSETGSVGSLTREDLGDGAGDADRRQHEALATVTERMEALAAAKAAEKLDEKILGGDVPLPGMEDLEGPPPIPSEDNDLPPIEPDPGADIHFGELPQGTNPGASTAEAPPIAPLLTVSTRLLSLPDRTVGSRIAGKVEVTAHADVDHAVVSATGDSGLEVAAATGGVLYEGPLRANDPTTIQLPIRATRPGTYSIDVKLDPGSGGDPIVSKLYVPIGDAAPSPGAGTTTPPAVAGESVSAGFRNTPVRQALEDIAKLSKLEVEIGDDVGDERVTRDLEDVSGAAALKTIAEDAGYQATYTDGKYVITRATGGD
ncbi:MAG TPA: hypothetical protein QGH10_24035 [Armatimonadota bacterium]|nr:hypothetical protein [Armatimonadota bacterium]